MGVAALLAAVRPRLALVSSASLDGVSAQALRCRAAGIRVLHTGRVGDIEVRATTPPTVQTERPWPLLDDR